MKNDARALMRRVSDFAHFLPDTQWFSNFGLLKIEKNTKKRRKKNARPGATGGEILYSILHYCFSHVIGIRTDRGKPFLVIILAQLAVQPRLQLAAVRVQGGAEWGASAMDAREFSVSSTK